ncbi:hypothetical protein ABID08_006104, partial [Rhizobium binae]
AWLSCPVGLNLCDIIKTPIRRLKTKAQYQSPGDPRNNAVAAMHMLEKKVWA